MTVNQFISECKSFPYSKEYFELYKEECELNIMNLYNDNFYEDGNDKDVKKKKEGFFKNIWNTIKSLLTKFWNWLKSFFSSKKQDAAIKNTNKILETVTPENKEDLLAIIAEAEKDYIDKINKNKLLPEGALVGINIANADEAEPPSRDNSDIPVIPKPDPTGIKTPMPVWLVNQLTAETPGDVTYTHIKDKQVIKLLVDKNVIGHNLAMSVRSLTSMMRSIDEKLKPIKETDVTSRIDVMMKVIRKYLDNTSSSDCVEVYLGHVVFNKNYEELEKITDRLYDILPDRDMVKAGVNPDDHTKTLTEIHKSLADTVSIYSEIRNSYIATTNFIATLLGNNKLVK